jgi:hypothetical protein
LSAFIFKANRFVSLIRVYKRPESRAKRRARHDFVPFAFVVLHQKLHLLFEFRANPQRIINDHAAKMINSTLQRIEPDTGPRGSLRSNRDSPCVTGGGVGAGVDGDFKSWNYGRPHLPKRPILNNTTLCYKYIRYRL